jgi:hypothetical protein
MSIYKRYSPRGVPANVMSRSAIESDSAIINPQDFDVDFGERRKPLAPLAFARFPVVIAVHFRVWAVP